MIFTVKLLLPDNKKDMKDLRWACRLKGEKRWKQIGLAHIINIAVKTLKEPVFQGDKACHNIHHYISSSGDIYIVGEYEYILGNNPPEGLLTFLQSSLDIYYGDAFIRNVRKYVLSLPDDITTNGV